MDAARRNRISLKIKCPDETEFSFLLSLCQPPLFLIPLSLLLCLALLQKAINLGQACSSLSPLTHSGRGKTRIPADIQHILLHAATPVALKGMGIWEVFIHPEELFRLLKKCVGELPTWRESDIGDDVLAVVEGHQVLQGVCVHNEETAVIQAHR